MTNRAYFNTAEMYCKSCNNNNFHLPSTNDVKICEMVVIQATSRLGAHYYDSKYNISIRHKNPRGLILATIVCRRPIHPSFEQTYSCR